MGTTWYNPQDVQRRLNTYLPHVVQLPRRSQCFPSWNWVPPKKDAEVGVYPNDFLGEFTKTLFFLGAMTDFVLKAMTEMIRDHAITWGSSASAHARLLLSVP